MDPVFVFQRGAAPFPDTIATRSIDSRINQYREMHHHVPRLLIIPGLGNYLLDIDKVDITSYTKIEPVMVIHDFAPH